MGRGRAWRAGQRRPGPRILDDTGQEVCPGPPWCRMRHARGERSGRAKLTDEQVAELRRRAAAGERQVDLARDYSCSQGLVSVLVRGLRRIR